VDRFRLARYVVWAKNWFGRAIIPGRNVLKYPIAGVQPSWLMIHADNPIHLICNYCALRWL
jgi:hypothetical protein